MAIKLLDRTGVSMMSTAEKITESYQDGRDVAQAYIDQGNIRGARMSLGRAEYALGLMYQLFSMRPNSAFQRDELDRRNGKLKELGGLLKQLEARDE